VQIAQTALFRSEIAGDVHYNVDMQASADRELIDASRRGDPAAFAQIIERYQRAVYAVAFSGTRERALADDVTQEAFLIAWRRLGDVTDAARLPAWLCGIARNVARDARRRCHRETVQDAEHVIDATTPYEALSEAESERIVAAALGQVPDVYREPLVLYYYEERSIADVARCLGLTAATTNKRLSRGRRFLAERVAIVVERGLARRGVRPTLAASVLAILGISAPASHVDASPVQKGSLMHKLAIAASLVAALTTGGIVLATATHGGNAHASAPAHTTQGGQPAVLPEPHAQRASRASHLATPGSPSLSSLLTVHRERAAAVPAANTCGAVGHHLADLEGETGHASDDPARCASDFAAICESEGWSLERRSCALAADNLINAHLCAVAPANPPDTEVPPALACSVIAPHVAPIVQGAGFYADVPDFAAEIESACEDGAWSITLRQCFAAAQGIEDLHACIQN
jgi:RNA polymerase sigma factor (sigma-70 family)